MYLLNAHTSIHDDFILKQTITKKKTLSVGGNCHGASWAGVQHEEQAFDVAHKHVNRRQIQRQRILRCACKQLSQNPIGIVTCDLAFNFVVDHPITFF